MKISLLLPTRGRPQNMKRMWESAYATAEYRDKIEVCFYIDDDDEPSIRQAQQMEAMYPGQVKFLAGPRITMSDMTNYAYELSEGEIVSFMGDDILFRTGGWDNLVYETFQNYPDKILLVGGHDGYNIDIITHGFLSRKWVDTLGYVVPWGFVGDYADVVVNDIATALGRNVRINILVEHMHYAAGKGTVDKTMQEKLQRTYGVAVPGQQVYYNRRNQTLQDAAKLQAVIDNYNNGRI